jgi:hypothetical protein
LLALVVTGRLHWLGALAAAALALLRLLIPLLLPLIHQRLSHTRGGGSSRATQQSNVETAILRMTLDHDSGRIDGVVISGPFEGRQLRQLNDDDVMALYHYCCTQDDDSARLLQGYLEQRLGPDWQDAQAPPHSHSAGPMTQHEALAILGLDEAASREQILQAHRRLMQKLHPDRGGNHYLAAQLNQARDTLLSRTQG